LQRRGIRFCAAVPLQTRAGHVAGKLCVLDTRPRSVSAREISTLRSLADQFMQAIEARVPAAA
jgi:GAF domain-containing protein